MGRDSLSSGTGLLRALRGWATTIEVIAAGPFDLPVFCAVGGGEREPAVLITAGSHADETSGMKAAATLLDTLSTEHKVYVVPNRDPLGWEGLLVGLGLAAGVAAPTGFEPAYDLLRSAGDVLYEDGHFLVAEVGQLAFVLVRPTRDTFGSEKAIKMLAFAMSIDTALSARLAGRRVLVPANAPDCDGRGVLDRAYTVLVAKDGFIGSLNRFFGDPAAPAEVAAMADLVDELTPGLTIDLHEGWNDAYYMFVPEPPTGAPLEKRLQTSIGTALREGGYPTSSLSELAPNMPDEHLKRFVDRGDGQLGWRWPSRPQDSLHGLALMPYALRHGLAYQTEVGRWSSNERRVAYQRLVVRTLLDEWMK